MTENQKRASDLFPSDDVCSTNSGAVIRLLKDADGRNIRLVGITPGKKCKECNHFYWVQYSKLYRRCKFDPKKNWKSNLEACGQFEERKP